MCSRSRNGNTLNDAIEFIHCNTKLYITGQNWTSTCLNKNRFDHFFSSALSPNSHYFQRDKRDKTTLRIPSSGQTKILIKLKLMMVNVFRLENIFETAFHSLSLSLSRARSIDPNIRASQILFTFQQLRCQDSILSDMCYQSNRGLKLYVLTITIDDILVWFFFFPQFFSLLFFFFVSFFFSPDNVNHFQFPRAR